MEIKKLTEASLEACDAIYEEARAFMRESGNPYQWVGYPSLDVIRSDIEKGQLYGVFDEGSLVGVFCFFVGNEPTYDKIYGGTWQQKREYGVIHRVAVRGAARGRGVAASCFNYAAARAKSVRIDTHRDNIPMQKSLLKNGFEQRGIIYLQSGDERIAFEKCK